MADTMPMCFSTPGYDSCFENDDAVSTLWDFLVSNNRLAAEDAASDCFQTREKYGCGDVAIASLCPQTCMVCVNGVHRGVSEI